MILFLKRLLADIIDVILFIVVYSLLVITSGLENSVLNLTFFTLTTSLFIFFLPIFLISNTIGKHLLKLEWKGEPALKIKLSLKYLFYLILFNPNLNPISIITSFPYFNREIINPDILFELKLTIAFFICDFFVFIFSTGKFRIIDYFLNLTLVGKEYSKRTFSSLNIVLSYFAILLFINVIQYKYSFTFSSFANRMYSKLAIESFPVDLVHGGYIMAVLDDSEEVFVPSRPLTFIYPKALLSKTIYIHLPIEIFKSEQARKEISSDVLFHSLRNDIYLRNKPSITRLVVTSSENGLFDYSHYTYKYYFDSGLMEWGIYGGIKADSTTVDKYFTFIREVTNDKQERLEKSFEMSFDQILERAEIDSVFSREVNAEYSISSFEANYTYSQIEIKIEDAKLKLDKIDFDEVKMQGFRNLNFPYDNSRRQYFTLQDFNNENILEDENVEQMKYIVKNISDQFF